MELNAAFSSLCTELVPTYARIAITKHKTQFPDISVGKWLPPVVVPKFVYKFFDIPLNKWWCLCPLPLNPGQVVIAPGESTMKRCHLTWEANKIKAKQLLPCILGTFAFGYLSCWVRCLTTLSLPRHEAGSQA